MKKWITSPQEGCDVQAATCHEREAAPGNQAGQSRELHDLGGLRGWHTLQDAQVRSEVPLMIQRVG